MKFSTNSIRANNIEIVTFNHRLTDTSISTVINPNHNVSLENGSDIRFVFEDTIELYAMRDTLNILIKFIERNYEDRIEESQIRLKGCNDDTKIQSVG
jgi:hypothetical protein